MDIKIKEDPNFVKRDGVGVINVNTSEYENTLRRRAKEREYEDLKTQVKSLEDLVKQLLEANKSIQ